MARRTKQLKDCPYPAGRCSHPDICQSHGCGALEARRNKAVAGETFGAAALRIARAQYIGDDQPSPPDPRDAEIAALRAEVERLREALTNINYCAQSSLTEKMDLGRLARVALEEPTT